MGEGTYLVLCYIAGLVQQKARDIGGNASILSLKSGKDYTQGLGTPRDSGKVEVEYAAQTGHPTYATPPVTRLISPRLYKTRPVGTRGMRLTGTHKKINIKLL